jgi:hypothetical protein
VASDDVVSAEEFVLPEEQTAITAPMPTTSSPAKKRVMDGR